jgi:agmatinase
MAHGTPTDGFAGGFPGGFLGVPVCDGAAGLAGRGARAAILGAGIASPYRGAGAYAAQAPAAIRAAAAPFASGRGHVNFDLGRPGFAEGAVVDCGDLTLDPADGAGNRVRIRHAVAGVLATGAVPVVLGGDDSVVVPVLQGFEGRGPVTVLQVGATIGWREQLEGERWGHASAMRRVAEMAHVAGLVQLGARGLGSVRAEDLAAARGWGAAVMAAPELARAGVSAALEAIPEGAAVHLALSWGALDPAVMPAVPVRLAGGLGYWQALELIAGAARRGRIVGITLTDLAPDRDIRGQGAATAAQLLAAALGLIADERQAG